MIIDYLKEYMIYCQTDYSNSFINTAFMTTNLEKSFWNNDAY